MSVKGSAAGGSVRYDAQRRPAFLQEDPLESLWCGVLAGLGLNLSRDTEAFVAYDGAGTLSIAPPQALDADDTLTQLVVHELCHWACEGPRACEQVDWGFGPPDEDTAPERRCLVLQAHLGRLFGLETLLRPTTDFAPWYDEVLATGQLPPAGLLQRPPIAPSVLSALENIAILRRGLARAGRLWPQPVP